jgi:hypothetical protein
MARVPQREDFESEEEWDGAMQVMDAPEDEMDPE